MKKLPLLLVALLFSGAVSLAQTADETALKKAVEELRLLLISPDRQPLEKITSAQLSYGHSNGRIEDQQEFVAFMLSGVSKFVTIELQDQTVEITGNIGIVRHTLVAETNNLGEIVPIKIGVLMIWQKEQNVWKLLARQAFKL
jgi:hypothetical protein